MFLSKLTRAAASYFKTQKRYLPNGGIIGQNVKPDPEPTTEPTSKDNTETKPTPSPRNSIFSRTNEIFYPSSQAEQSTVNRPKQG